MILDRGDVEERSAAMIQLADLLGEDGSENCPGHDGTASRPRPSRRLSVETLQQVSELTAKRSHHSDAIFDLRIIAIVPPGWHLSSGAQVNLVPKKSESCSQLLRQILLHGANFLDDLPAVFRRDRGQTLVGVKTSKTQRHNRHAGHARVKSGQIKNCAPQNFTVIDLRTKNHLRMDFYPRIEQAGQLVRDIGAIAVDTQKISAHIKVSRVHGDVLWRKTLLDNATHFIFCD